MKNLQLYIIAFLLLSCSENNSDDNKSQKVNLSPLEGYTSTIDSISIQDGTFILHNYSYSEDGKTTGFSITNESNSTRDFFVYYTPEKYELWQKEDDSKALALNMKHENGWLISGQLVHLNWHNNTTDIIFDYSSTKEYSFKWIDSGGDTTEVTEVYINCDEQGNPKSARWTDKNIVLQAHFSFAPIPNPYFRRIEVLIVDEIMDNFESAISKPYGTTNYNGQQIPVSRAMIIYMPWLPIIAYNAPKLINSFKVNYLNEVVWNKSLDYQVDSLRNKIVSFDPNSAYDSTHFYFSKL